MKGTSDEKLTPVGMIELPTLPVIVPLSSLLSVIRAMVKVPAPLFVKSPHETWILFDEKVVGFDSTIGSPKFGDVTNVSNSRFGLTPQSADCAVLLLLDGAL